MGCGVESGTGRAEGRSQSLLLHLLRLRQSAESSLCHISTGRIKVMGHYAGQNRTKMVTPTNRKKREEGSYGVAESRHIDWFAMSDCYRSYHGYNILYLSRKIAWKHELRSGLVVCIYSSQIFLHITWRIMVSSILVFGSLHSIRTELNVLFLSFLSSLARSRFPIPGRVHTDLIRFYVC